MALPKLIQLGPDDRANAPFQVPSVRIPLQLATREKRAGPCMTRDGVHHHPRPTAHSPRPAAGQGTGQWNFCGPPEAPCMTAPAVPTPHGYSALLRNLLPSGLLERNFLVGSAPASARSPPHRAPHPLLFARTASSAERLPLTPPSFIQSPPARASASPPGLRPSASENPVLSVFRSLDATLR